jgi:hypothetical protein
VFGQFRLLAQNLVANTDVAWLWADGKALVGCHHGALRATLGLLAAGVVGAWRMTAAAGV